MSKPKIFIDGKEGTTGLQIYERFANRDDIEILLIDEEKRKDINERKRLINESDYTFLCLPDVASIESVSLCENPNTKIIDASTAHRTNPDWAYGLPELSKAHREKIASSKRVAVPGCYASGFISCVYPLVQSKLMAPFHPVSCFAVSGYSGAGKKAIAVYEGEDKPYSFNSPRQYALSQTHKHQKEMMAISGLSYIPIFNPIVDDYYNGMVVSVPLHLRTLAKRVNSEKVWEILKEHYKDEYFVEVMEFGGSETLADGFLPANTLCGTNKMRIYVFGDNDRCLVAAQLDNLGKGASGAAIQCMNIMMGIDEKTGLE